MLCLVEFKAKKNVKLPRSNMTIELQDMKLAQEWANRQLGLWGINLESVRVVCTPILSTETKEQN